MEEEGWHVARGKSKNKKDRTKEKAPQAKELLPRDSVGTGVLSSSSGSPGSLSAREFPSSRGTAWRGQPTSPSSQSARNAFSASNPAPAPGNLSSSSPPSSGLVAPATQSHPYPKPCIFFLKGQCRNGAECRFSHADTSPRWRPAFVGAAAQEELLRLVAVIEDPFAGPAFRPLRSKIIHGSEDGFVWDSILQSADGRGALEQARATRAASGFSLHDDALALLFFSHLLDLCREHIYCDKEPYLEKRSTGRKVPEFHTPAFADALSRAGLEFEQLIKRLDVVLPVKMDTAKDINRFRNRCVYELGHDDEVKRLILAEVNELDVKTLDEAKNKAVGVMEQHGVAVEDARKTVDGAYQPYGLTNIAQLLHILYSEYFKPLKTSEDQQLGFAIQEKVRLVRKVLVAVPELLQLPAVLLKLASEGAFHLPVGGGVRHKFHSAADLPDIGALHEKLMPRLNRIILEGDSEPHPV